MYSFAFVEKISTSLCKSLKPLTNITSDSGTSGLEVLEKQILSCLRKIQSSGSFTKPRSIGIGFFGPNKLWNKKLQRPSDFSPVGPQDFPEDQIRYNTRAEYVMQTLTMAVGHW